jgi:hypothetical protein
MTKEAIERIETQAKELAVMAAQTKEIEKLTEINKRAREDWADDDTRVKEAAKPFFTDFEINGDSYGVPGVIDIAELMAKRIQEQAKEIEGLKAQREGVSQTIGQFIAQTETLRTENERLRKALVRIANGWGWQGIIAFDTLGIQVRGKTCEEAKALLAEVPIKATDRASDTSAH